MKRNEYVLRVLFALVGIFLLTGAAPARPLNHITMTVTTTADELRKDGDCSLREAIYAANTGTAFDRCPAGSDYTTIRVPAGRYTFTIAGREENAGKTGDLDLKTNIKLVGAGMNDTIIDAAGLDRLIDVRLTTISTVLMDMTMQNGLIENQDPERNDGGGIYNRGKLTIYRVRLRFNKALSPEGAFGGGIYNTGTLAATALFLQNNTAESIGGGLVNQGRMTLASSRIYSNSAMGVAGMLLLPNSVTTIRDSRILYNYASDQWGPTLGNAFRLRENARLLVERTTIHANGPNPIYSEGALTFRQVTIGSYANTASMTVAIGSARISDSVFTNDVGGHALHVKGSTSVVVERSTAYDLAGAFLQQEGGVVKIVNSTITGAAAMENFLKGEKGILWVTGGRLSLESDTIADNSSILPTLQADGGTVVLHNTIIARSLDTEGNPVPCRDVQVDGAVIVNQGYNLIGSVCEENHFTKAATDLVGTTTLLDPVLGPLQDNGGKTPTRALLRGNPAINRGDPNLFMPTDQRGVTRPQGTRPDIGAYEVRY